MQILIEGPPKRLVRFDSIYPGNVFRAHDGIFMRLYRDYEMGESKYNCVSMEYTENNFFVAGGLYHCQPDDEVEIPSSEELRLSFA